MAQPGAAACASRSRVEARFVGSRRRFSGCNRGSGLTAGSGPGLGYYFIGPSGFGLLVSILDWACVSRVGLIFGLGAVDGLGHHWAFLFGPRRLGCRGFVDRGFGLD